MKSLDDALHEVVDTAVSLVDADSGTLRFPVNGSNLKIAAQRGCPDWWVRYWDERSEQGYGIRDAALQRNQRVVIEDAFDSPWYTDPMDRDSMVQFGIRSAVTTQIVSSSGAVMGFFTTHWRTVRRPDKKTLEVLDLLANHAASLIERAQANQALRDIGNRYQAIFDSAPAGIVQVESRHLRVVEANGAFCRMLGYSEQEVVGKHIINDLTWPQDRQKDFLGAKRLTSGEIDHYRPVKRFLRKDGMPVWVELDASHLKTDDGAVGDFIGVVTNLTEQRKSEELARARLEEVFHLQRRHTANELASVLAHEINQPLAAMPIYGVVARRLLEKPEIDRADLSNVIDRMQGLSLQAGEIIQKMRGFYDCGKIDPVPMDLNAAVESALSMMVASGRRLKIDLVADLDETLPAVWGVQVHIEQIMLNLLRNAFEAIAEQQSSGGAVTVRTAVGEGVARVTVSDTGPGVDATAAERLFDLLGSKKVNGLGVGLRISRTLIEAHHGRLWVQPHVPGAIFHFELPLA